MIGLAGRIYKDGKEVGSYGCSFLSCSYSWVIGEGTPHHFWKKEEMVDFLHKNGYTLEGEQVR